MKLVIVQQQGQMEGAIELVEYPVTGPDFTMDLPDQRGWASFLFPVPDLAAAFAGAQHAGWVVSETVTLEWPLFGFCRSASLITPWAARLVFLQPG